LENLRLRRGELVCTMKAAAKKESASRRHYVSVEVDATRKSLSNISIILDSICAHVPINRDG
jgi:hypothetical protein